MASKSAPPAGRHRGGRTERGEFGKARLSNRTGDGTWSREPSVGHPAAWEAILTCSLAGDDVSSARGQAALIPTGRLLTSSCELVDVRFQLEAGGGVVFWKSATRRR